MLTEEAHHLFVGEAGVGRVIQRTCEAMKLHKTDDPAALRAMGVIDLLTLQKYINFHFSVTSDLYGSEFSSNAASYFVNGLKARFDESRIADDHQLGGETYSLMDIVDDRIISREVAALSALNERLRDDWTVDVQAGVDRWNRIPEKLGLAFRFKLPHKGFHRKIGMFAEIHVDPDGRLLSEADWTRRHADWLPTAEDRDFVHTLMGRVADPGKFANWIAPPNRGINNQPIEFEYVRFG